MGDSELSYRGIARAFDVLIETSWSDVDPPLDAVHAATDRETLRAALATLFSHVHARHPGAHLWVKDQDSRFLAACSNLVAACGLDEETFLSGINDLDPRIAWNRQGPLYVRDDAEVFASGTPKVNIIERQDRPGGEVVWLKTSKVPFRNADGVTGGTVGGFEVITDKEAWQLSRA